MNLPRWVGIAFAANVAAVVVVAVLFSIQGDKFTAQAQANRRLSRANAATIRELRRDKASIGQLQRTNCKLRHFSEAAARSRARAAEHDTDAALRRNDRQAAAEYRAIASGLSNPACPA